MPYPYYYGRTASNGKLGHYNGAGTHFSTATEQFDEDHAAHRHRKWRLDRDN